MQSAMEVKRYSPGLQQYVDEKPIDMYLIASVGGVVEVFAIVHMELALCTPNYCEIGGKSAEEKDNH